MINKMMTHDGIFKISDDQKLVEYKCPMLANLLGEYIFVTKRDTNSFDGKLKNGLEIKNIPYEILSDYNIDLTKK